MITNYIAPFFYALCLIVLSLALGYLWNLLARLLFKATPHRSLFWTYFTGLLLGVSATAISVSGGVTLLLLLPLLLLLLQRYIPRDDYPFRQDFVLLLVAAVVQYGLFLWMFSSRDSSMITIVHGDFNIYFRAAWRLWQHGIEAYNFSIYASESTLPNVYHYGDLWLYAICGGINKFQPTHSFLTAFTVLSTLFTLGLVNLLRGVFRGVRPGMEIFLFVLAGAFSAFAWCMPPFIARFAEPYTLSVFNWGKVLLLGACMVAALLLAHKRALSALLLLVLVTALCYINALPAFYGAFLILLLVVAFQKEATWPSVIAKAVLVPVGIVVPMAIQYKVFPKLLHLTDRWSVLDSVKPFGNLAPTTYLKTSLNIFLGGWFQLFTLAPYFVLLGIGLLMSGFFKELRLRDFFRRLDLSLIYLFGLFFAGLCSWAVTYPLQVDTVQFFHNTLAPIYCIAISLILCYLLWSVSNKLLGVLATMVALISVYLSISTPFFSGPFPRGDWQRLSAFLDEGPEQNGMFLCSNTQGALGSAFLRKSDQYVPLNILVYRYPQYQNPSLVSPFLQLNKSDVYYHEAYTDLRTSSLGRFFAVQKRRDTSEVIVDFIRSQPFSYYTVYRDTTMPEYLRPYAGDSCILEQSNIIVYRLKSPKKVDE